MPASNLKIFVVGPKQAGKTVFASRLNSYVMSHPEAGVLCKVADWPTKAHFAAIDEELAKQKWPLDTLPLKPGQQHTELKWEWEFGRRRAFFDLVDPAGEDIERVMRGEGEGLPILDKIRTANVLFVLVDLHGHQGDSPQKRTQNGWIIENVLKEASEDSRLVIGISKGDLMLERLPVEDWSDKEKLMGLISATMPEFNLSAYRQRLQNPRVRIVMFSAVTSEPYLDENGMLRRRPKKPLESQGFEIFVESITQADKDKRWREFALTTMQGFKSVVTSRLFLILLLMAAAFLSWKISRQTFKITFKTSSLTDAGTDGRVSLRLIGSTESEWLEFDGRKQPDNNPDPFEVGSEDVFVRTVWSPGPIREVKLRINFENSGRDKAWLLEKLSVEELDDGSSGSRYIFSHNQWLTAPQAEVTLSPR